MKKPTIRKSAPTQKMTAKPPAVAKPAPKSMVGVGLINKS